MDSMTDPLNPPAVYENLVSPAETLASLQSVIERHAVQLKEIKKKQKLVREQEVSLLDNDPEYSRRVDEAERYVQAIKQEKARVKSTPESVAIKLKKDELKEEEKELAESLSNHLANYFNLTGSKVFDTSDGKQIKFKVKASIDSGQLSLF